MSDELNIPLLEDLLVKGQVDSKSDQPDHRFDDHIDVDYEPDVQQNEHTQTVHTKDKSDELSNDANIRELIIDEEIRMILDKHMDNAYEEIILLLNHKIS